MMSIEHRWTHAEPRRFGATVCSNCDVLCDTQAVDEGGPFFAADGTPLGRRCPPCPLVPELSDADLSARAQAMRGALEVVLLFHAADGWTEEKRVRWRELTGSSEATTRVLCDTVRRALRGGSTTGR